MKKVLAFDLGASNGRLMLSCFNGSQLEIKELHRFTNHPVSLNGHYYWDILRIFQEVKEGISKSLSLGHNRIQSLSIDSWGVDFGILSSNGELLGNPYSYRDPHSNESLEKILFRIPKEELFKRTGVFPAAINTLFQLHAIQTNNPDLIGSDKKVLMTPNLISYFFSGIKANEFTISTTSSLYNLKRGDWDHELMEMAGLPSGIMAQIVKPGTVLGPTLGSINRELGMESVKVIAGAGHDTACALAALPIQKENSAFMSCGTWTIMGVQVKEPVVTNEALNLGYTNEGTADGEFRLLKNIMGLWLIQQCKHSWSKKGKNTTYKEDSMMIGKAEPFTSFIDPDDPAFFNPGDMPEQIIENCLATQQTPPEKPGQFLRVILESLSLKYRWTIENLEFITNKRIECIHMGGGGIQNERLCQFTANATNRIVIAGPVEASAIGNSLTQWITLGEIKDYAEGREIIKNSFPVKIYEPQNQAEWEEAYSRFLKLFN